MPSRPGASSAAGLAGRPAAGWGCGRPAAFWAVWSLAMERVEFGVDGIALVGDLRAPSAGGRAPGLVFTGPFTGVRDQVTGLYAERLAAAGVPRWRLTTATLVCPGGGHCA